MAGDPCSGVCSLIVAIGTRDVANTGRLNLLVLKTVRATFEIFFERQWASLRSANGAHSKNLFHTSAGKTPYASGGFWCIDFVSREKIFGMLDDDSVESLRAALCGELSRDFSFFLSFFKRPNILIYGLEAKKPANTHDVKTAIQYVTVDFHMGNKQSYVCAAEDNVELWEQTLVNVAQSAFSDEGLQRLAQYKHFPFQKMFSNNIALGI